MQTLNLEVRSITKGSDGKLYAAVYNPMNEFGFGSGYVKLSTQMRGKSQERQGRHAIRKAQKYPELVTQDFPREWDNPNHLYRVHPKYFSKAVSNHTMVDRIMTSKHGSMDAYYNDMGEQLGVCFKMAQGEFVQYMIPVGSPFILTVR